MRMVIAQMGLRISCACALLLCTSGVLSAQFGGFGGMMGMGNTAGGGAPTGGFSGVHPWLAANGSYSENLSVDSSFNHDPSALGYGASAGLNGGKSWQRQSLAGAATVSHQRFGGGGPSSGVSFASALGYTRQLSQRASFFASQSFSTTFGGYGYGAGMGSFGSFGMSGLGVFQDFGMGGGFGFPDPANNGVVDADVIGTRVNFMASSAGFSFQPNLRWQFGVGGTVTIARRESARLNDVTSYGGGGSAGYRVSERLTVGVSSQYSTFSYGGQYSDNKAFSGGLGFTYQFNPNTSASVMAGVSSFRSSSFGSVAIDPVVASLIGTPSVLELQKVNATSGGGSANISHSRGPFGLSASYDRGISPGNGLLYASFRDAVNGSISYRPVTRLGFGLFSNYSRLRSLVQAGARNDSTSVGGNVDVKLTNTIYFTMGGGYRHNKLSDDKTLSQRFATVGLSWSPEGAMFRF